MPAILVDDVADLSKVRDMWPLLSRRSNDRVEVRSRLIAPDDRLDIERRLNSSLADCGCSEGAAGVLTFTGVGVLSILFRAPQLLAAKRLTGTMRHTVICIGGAAVLGGLIGKVAGLHAARIRFNRSVHRAHQLMEPRSPQPHTADPQT